MNRYPPSYYREAKRRSYWKHRERLIVEQRERAREMKAFFVAERGATCLDCGGAFPPEQFDFDHRDPSTKSANPSALMANSSVERIRAELVLCDMVCRCCHSTRTMNDPRLRAKRDAARNGAGGPVPIALPLFPDEEPARGR